MVRRDLFLLISIWSALGVQTWGIETTCVGQHDSSRELGDPSFTQDNANIQFTIECEYHVLQCRSINFCNIQWFFNGVPYDSWSLSRNSGTRYSLEERNQTLKFTSADINAEGNFTCVVSNGVKTISRTIALQIEEPIWLNKPIPYESTSSVCKNQTAVLGGNASFFCQFKYGNAGISFQHSWRKLNETYGGYQLVGYYDIPGTQFSEGDITVKENFTQTQICPELDPPKILSTWLNITNVTEEALGKYQVTCQIAQYFTAINLTLSLKETVEEPIRVTDTSSVVILVVTVTILLSVCVLSWKRYGTDVKLWYHDRHSKRETEEIDNKLYDAYIVSCYEGKDRSFVDNVLCPSLQDQYKLFLRERDAIFGSVTSEEIVEALTKSRRCIVVLSEDFYRPLPASSSEATPEGIDAKAVQPTLLSSSSSSVEISDHDFRPRTEWHLFELEQALDTMHPHVIPLLYRDSGPTSLSTSDSSAKLIDHVLNDLKCIEWKQKGKTCLDDWAMKRLRLRLPPRRQRSKPPGGHSVSLPMPVMSATTPSNISSSISFTNSLPLPNDRPSVVPSTQHHRSSVSGSESSKDADGFIEEMRSSQQKRPSQLSQISFMSTSMSPLSLSPPMSLSSSYGSGSMSIRSTDPQPSMQRPSSTYTSSSASSPSHPSTNSSPPNTSSLASTYPITTQELDNLNSFQEYEPNSNRFNSVLSIFKFFPGRKREPCLIDNESEPGYI